jgi:hypothetical protein
MLLLVGNAFYGQMSLNATYDTAPPFPYQVLPDELTNWKAWKKAHPDTDVYVGGPGAPPRPFQYRFLGQKR